VHGIQASANASNVCQSRHTPYSMTRTRYVKEESIDAGEFIAVASEMQAHSFTSAGVFPKESARGSCPNLKRHWLPFPE